ncbi:hypothetical protein D3C87_1560590 [compost metagenome]
MQHRPLLPIWRKTPFDVPDECLRGRCLSRARRCQHSHAPLRLALRGLAEFHQVVTPRVELDVSGIGNEDRPEVRDALHHKPVGFGGCALPGRRRLGVTGALEFQARGHSKPLQSRPLEPVPKLSGGCKALDARAFFVRLVLGFAFLLFGGRDEARPSSVREKASGS